MSEEPSNDSVTEVTTTGWLQRIVQSFVGAIIGIVLVIGSIVLLWWNEGRAVEAIRALDQGARQVVEANATAADPANNNKLVHLSGAMTTRAPARDTAFGVGGGDLLRLRRTVEMFQWTEQKSTRSQKNFGGSETTETTYSYHKEWSDHPVDSSHFHETGGHRDPPMPVHSATFDSQDVQLGAYRVDRGLLESVSAYTPYDATSAASLPADYRKTGDMLYRGADPAAPAIGDIRIRYTAVPSQTMSVVAAQVGNTLAPFSAVNGYRIALADPGVMPAAAMFREKAQEKSLLTWILRAVGFVLMLVGFLLMASPLTVLLGVVPLFETLADIGAFMLALLIALPLTLIVIAVAWIAHRPLIGGALVIAGLGLAYLLRRLHRARQPQPPTHFLPTGTLR
jgi:Transmembrane protein 43